MRKRHNSFLDQFFSDSLKEWHFSKNFVKAVWVLPFIVLFLGVLSGLIDKELYKLVTGEDRLGESLQLLFFAGGLILSLLVIRRLLSFGNPGIAALYLIIAVGLFLLIGEEISWGQRIFGWETSKDMSELNRQNETNLHNMYGIEAVLNWLQIIVGAFALLLAPIYKYTNIAERIPVSFAWTIPPLCLTTYFGAFFSWRFYRTALPRPDKYRFAIAEFSEIIELILALAIFFFMLYQWHRARLRH